MSARRGWVVRAVVTAGMVWTCLSAGAARAEDAGLWPRHRLVYSNLLAVRYNPLGFADSAALEYRLRLWNDPGLLFKDAWIGASFSPVITPAVTLVGGTVEVKPLTVLSLQASAYRQVWFGSFEYLQSYLTPTADFSDTALDAGRDADRNYAAGGTEVQLRATLLGKVGPVVIRNDTKFYWTDVSLTPGDTVYYSILVDHLMPDGGWGYTNDTDVLYLSGKSWVLGVRTTVTNAWYSEDSYVAGESTDNLNGPTVRTGPLFAWTFESESPYFQKPTILVIANWWLAHRWRTGADTSQALPYLVVGFKVDGELWASQ